MRLLTPFLRELDTPDGVVAVLGNHDYYFDAEAVTRWLEAWNVRVLRNASIEIVRGGERLALVGLEDAKEGTIDASRALGGVSPAVPRLVLSHNPDGVLCLAGAHVDAVLAGHTHGGQIVLPLVGAPIRFCRICGPHHARGWVPNDHAPLYVSSGVGGMVPLRVNVPPEIVVATLRRGPAAQQPV
jgi:predicted MPP superfamily phosphohydrolase